MTTKHKTLNTLQTLMASEYLARLDEGDPNVDAVLTLHAIYSADIDTLRLARTNPDVLAPLRAQAEVLPASEIAEVINFYLFCASRVLMGVDDGGIDHQPLAVRFRSQET